MIASRVSCVDVFYIQGRCLYSQSCYVCVFSPSSKLQSLPLLLRCTHTHTNTHRDRERERENSAKLDQVTHHKDYHSFVGQDLWHYQWVRSYLWFLCPCIFVICWMTRPIWCDTVAEPLTAFIILRPTEWLSRGEQLLRSHAVIVPFHLAAPLTSYPLSRNHTGIL